MKIKHSFEYCDQRFAVGLFNGIPKFQLVSAQVNATSGLPQTGSNPYAQLTNLQPPILLLFGLITLIVIGAGVTSVGSDIARQIARVRSRR